MNLDQKSKQENNGKYIHTWAIVTRNQNRKEGKLNKPLRVSKIMGIDNPEKFCNEQANDHTLSKLREVERGKR